jgi:hypothetical protein
MAGRAGGREAGRPQSSLWRRFLIDHPPASVNSRAHRVSKLLVSYPKKDSRCTDFAERGRGAPGAFACRTTAIIY